MYLLEALCQEDVSGWSCISCLYPVEEDLRDKILDSHFSGCWWQSCQMETISMLRCLVIVGLERSSSLEGVPGCVKESAPRRLCCWADKGQGLDVELIIPVLDMQRLGLWCGSLHYHAGSRYLDCNCSGCHSWISYWIVLGSGEDGFGSRSQYNPSACLNMNWCKVPWFSKSTIFEQYKQ